MSWMLLPIVLTVPHELETISASKVSPVLREQLLHHFRFQKVQNTNTLNFFLLCVFIVSEIPKRIVNSFL
jgi:hypothetical protein